VFVTNHVLSGVLVGRAFSGRPAVAFLAGVASHLALDAVPHWGCDLDQPGGPERFLKVARRDGVIGLASMATAVLLVDPRDRAATMAAMAGAVVLDLDKPFLHFFGRNPFPRIVQRVHGLVQNEVADGMPREFAYGLVFAASDVVVTARARRRVPARRRAGRR